MTLNFCFYTTVPSFLAPSLFPQRRLRCVITCSSPHLPSTNTTCTFLQHELACFKTIMRDEAFTLAIHHTLCDRRPSSCIPPQLVCFTTTPGKCLMSKRLAGTRTLSSASSSTADQPSIESLVWRLSLFRLACLVSSSHSSLPAAPSSRIYSTLKVDSGPSTLTP